MAENLIQSSVVGSSVLFRQRREMQQAWGIIRSDIIEYSHLTLTLLNHKPSIKQTERKIIYNAEASVVYGMDDPGFEFQ